MANGRHIENRFWPFFCFPTAFWASTSGGFRIVSDTLVWMVLPKIIIAALKAEAKAIKIWLGGQGLASRLHHWSSPMVGLLHLYIAST